MISRRLRNCQQIFLRSNGMKKEHPQNTVDKHEIVHHNKMANEWSDPYGPMRGLHALNKNRIELIRNGLINERKLNQDCVNSRHSLKGIKILDVGCGGGILSIPLSRLGAEVTGIDASSVLIDVAQNEACKNPEVMDKVKFINTTIEEHAISFQGNYDAIILSEVIEHVTQKEAFLEASVGTLKPSGSLFLTTLNKTLASWSLSIVAAEYIMNLLPKGTHEWNKLISPNDLVKHLEKVGCRVRLINGLIYNPLQNQWYWSPYDGLHYAVHAVRQK